MEYNSGNYEKYMTKNLLKRAMVKRLNDKILDIVEQEIGKYAEIFGGGVRKLSLKISEF